MALACSLAQFDAECAAVHENDDKGLTGGRHGFEEILFGFGQIETCAIAAVEADLADGHFFALEFAGNTNDGNDDISISGSRDGLRGWLQIHFAPHQARRGNCFVPAIFDLQSVGHSFLKVDTTKLGFTTISPERHEDDLAVECGA